MSRQPERPDFGRLRSTELLVFDLDGTLVDSSDDLAAAVNQTLRNLDLRTLPVAEITGYIGDGMHMLVTRALRNATGQPTVSDDLLDQAIKEFRIIYGARLLDHTRPIPGAEELLRRCAGIKKAVVTNKPYRFTVEILEALGLIGNFDYVAGGDSFTERKPDPAPLLQVAAKLGVNPSRAAMVGDAAQDILAGRAAGFLTIGVASGLRGREELVEAGAELIVEDLWQLAQWIARP